LRGKSFAELGNKDALAGLIVARIREDFAYWVLGLRQERRFTAYRAMQKTFAGIKPNCAVRNPITHNTALLTPAKIQPSQQRFPNKIVETTVNMQDK
jgi:hypothetical protein